MLFSNKKVRIQSIMSSQFFLENHVLDILREDELHMMVSGNKYRKLKYNCHEALRTENKCLLTFGGAHSNHIAATAAAAKEMGLTSVGVIRGEELVNKISENPTLSYAQACGMRLHFVTRDTYRQKDSQLFLNELIQHFGDCYILPEGGSNALAVKGCAEMHERIPSDYTYICTPVGTGGTLAGLVEGSSENQMILGFSALKGTFQTSEIQKFTSKMNYKLLDEYCFGGYAKIDATLVRFINEFKTRTGILLDPVYTGKMIFGILELIKKGYFPENSRILAVHTGGLQGIQGMNKRLKKKNLPQIDTTL